MGCMALLPASYTEDNKICLDLNGGKSENNIWMALLYINQRQKIKNWKVSPRLADFFLTTVSFSDLIY